MGDMSILAITGGSLDEITIRDESGTFKAAISLIIFLPLLGVK
jgi:hypothetical protein